MRDNHARTLYINLDILMILYHMKISYHIIIQCQHIMTLQRSDMKFTL